MNQIEMRFDLHSETVKHVLAFVLHLFVLAEKDLFAEDFISLFDDEPKAESAGVRPRIRTDFELTGQVAIRHAEIALTCLTLESLAFLTDEQHAELHEAHSRRWRHWQELLQICLTDKKLELFDEPTLRKADALFLTQIEWMSDVGFESCSRSERFNIFPESPLAFALYGT